MAVDTRERHTCVVNLGIVLSSRVVIVRWGRYLVNLADERLELLPSPAVVSTDVSVSGIIVDCSSTEHHLVCARAMSIEVAECGT